MRTYRNLIDDLNNLTSSFCCGRGNNKVIYVNRKDMNLLDSVTDNPARGHQIYGIPIELKKGIRKPIIKNL